MKLSRKGLWHFSIDQGPECHRQRNDSRPTSPPVRETVRSRYRRDNLGLACAVAAVVLALLGSGVCVSGQPADTNVLVAESFVGGEAALGRWEFKGEPKAILSLGPAGEGSQNRAVYIDYRERAAWRLLSRQTFALSAGEQYTLSAHVRRNLGYGETRLLAESVGTATPRVLAEAEVIDRSNTARELSVVFRVSADAEARIGFDASGYAELWIESIRLQRNVPAISPYRTGMLLPARSPTAQARFRTGAFLEAEDIVADAAVLASADSDGDGRWALCRVEPTGNPWLFSDETVLKSDTTSSAEGGDLPALQLTAKGLLPGPYEAILSDPQRDAAVSLDGRTWRRVQGGAGEINLGLLEVTGELSVWVAHRFLTAANPGPIYVDYLRLMPVYAAARGLEKPLAAAPAPAPAPVQQTTLRLVQSATVPRRAAWVTAGMPFARGAFRPGDGLSIRGVTQLSMEPLVLWPDGSVKWLRLRFQADTDAASTELPVEYGRAVPPVPPAQPVAARLELRGGAGGLALAGDAWDGLEFTARLRSAGGVCYDRLREEPTDRDISNSREDRYAYSVGHLMAADGSLAPLAFQAVVTAVAPRTLSLRFSVLNESDERYEPEKGCSPALALTELALVVTDRRAAAPVVVQWPGAALPWAGAAQVLQQAGSGGCVAEFKGAWSLRSGTTTVASGERTEGWLDLRGPGAGLAVGVREFLERSPQTLAVQTAGEDAAVEVGIWPLLAAGRVLRFAQGTRLTTEIALVRHDGDLPEPERAARLAAGLDPLQAWFTPAYYCQTGVFGPLTATRDPRFEGYYKGATHALQTLRAEHMRYGLEDWGDTFDRCGYVRTESILWTNMEWNYVATLVLEFVRSGEPEFWQAALQAARHFVDVDVAHVSSTPAWTGGAYVHTGDTREGHQVDPPDFAHAGWPEGLLWLYYLAGDERFRETSVGLADYVVRNLPPDGPYQTQPPFSMWNCDRQAGNPILTLTAVYELTHDPAHLLALNRLVDFAVRAQDPKLGCWSVPNYEEPSRHYPSPAWGAVLPRGLYRYWEMTGDERVARAFRRLGDFHLAQHPPEARHHLKPGSYYRTNVYFVTEACAFAALFAADPGALIEKGLAPLGELFPPASPKALDARGAPGALSAASRLAGAAAMSRPN